MAVVSLITLCFWGLLSVVALIKPCWRFVALIICVFEVVGLIIPHFEAYKALRSALMEKCADSVLTNNHFRQLAEKGKAFPFSAILTPLRKEKHFLFQPVPTLPRKEKHFLIRPSHDTTFHYIDGQASARAYGPDGVFD